MKLLQTKSTGRILSYGGGVQSNALLSLVAQGKLYVDAVVFANVGNDSEHPKIISYVNDHVKPFCEAHNIPFYEVQKTLRDGTLDTVKQRVERSGGGFGIPMYQTGGKPNPRACTQDHKIAVVHKFCRDVLDIARAEMLLGFTIDEYYRVRSKQWQPSKYKGFEFRFGYPLIDMGLHRNDCYKLVSEVGLPRPHKSACYFCPFTKRNEWVQMRANEPELFMQAVEFERGINDKRKLEGKTPIYIHPDLLPLDRATAQQNTLFTEEEMDRCGVFSCFT